MLEEYLLSRCADMRRMKMKGKKKTWDRAEENENEKHEKIKTETIAESNQTNELIEKEWIWYKHVPLGTSQHTSLRQWEIWEHRPEGVRHANASTDTRASLWHGRT